MNTGFKNSRDAFTFSLRGFSAKSPVALTQAIADDRIRKAWDEKLSRPQEDQPDTSKEMNFFWGRFWLRARRRAA